MGSSDSAKPDSWLDWSHGQAKAGWSSKSRLRFRSEGQLSARSSTSVISAMARSCNVALEMRSLVPQFVAAAHESMVSVRNLQLTETR